MNTHSELVDLEQSLEVAVDTARHAGDFLLGLSSKHPDVTPKGQRDFSTQADRAVQRFIVERIRSHYPTAAFIAEEPDESLNSNGEMVWVIDPIDGTINFARQIPLFCVSLAAVINGRVCVGVVYDPSRNELYAAAEGHGVSLNGATLPTGEPKTVPGSVVAFDWDQDDVGRKHAVRAVSRLSEEFLAVDVFGSAALALAWLADGRIDGYFNLRLDAWDVAAGSVLVRESGRTVKHINGSDWRWDSEDPSCVAGDESLVQRLAAVLEDTEQEIDG